MVKINSSFFAKKEMAAFPFLDLKQSEEIFEELSAHTFTKAPLSKGNNVRQYYDEANLDPLISPKTVVKLTELEELLKDSLIMPKLYSFNSFKLHWYHAPLQVGISRHHDGARFEGPIVILVLKHGGQFCTYTDKERVEPSDIISASVGHCIVINNAIDHAVMSVEQDRFTVTCRFDTKPTVPL